MAKESLWSALVFGRVNQTVSAGLTKQIDLEDLPPLPAAPPAGGAFEALFVGSGGQRKGLHHLCLAWRRAKLPAGSPPLYDMCYNDSYAVCAV